MIHYGPTLHNLFNQRVTNAFSCEVLELGGLGRSGMVGSMISDVLENTSNNGDAGDDH